MIEDTALLKRRIERERKARHEAEQILEVKALQLYQANEQLKSLNENLEAQVKEKVRELQKSEKRYRELISRYKI